MRSATNLCCCLSTKPTRWPLNAVDQHMHHEDKAGLNTLLQRIDGLRLGKRRVAVIFVTNRPTRSTRQFGVAPRCVCRSGGPATSPDRNFRQSLAELNPNDEQLRELAAVTGPKASKRYGASFTASDVTDRLLPAAVSEAYEAGRPLGVLDVIAHA